LIDQRHTLYIHGFCKYFPVFLGKILPTLAERLHEHLSEHKHAGHPLSGAAVEGTEQLVRWRQVIWMFFDVVDERAGSALR
jgi:hypothetical protein